MSSDSVDSDLSSDWAFIPSASDTDEGKVKPNENDDENTLSIDNSEKVSEDYIQTGSKVQDVPNEPEPTGLNDASSSSSDIDIIDEIVEDNISPSVLPSSHLSFSAPLESSTTETESTANNANEEDDIQAECFGTTLQRVFHETLFSIMNALLKISKPELCFMFLMILPICIHFYFKPTLVSIDAENKDGIIQMKQLIKELQFENRDLKKQIISEIQNEKVFTPLEIQIKELKKENLKLSEMLQDVITELQKQSISHENEMEMKETESLELYNNEINKLKEQVNILQFDNEELQKQLVRMRYGRFSASQQDQDDTNDMNKMKNEPKREGKNENSAENLTEDVKELRKVLYEEVSKLKKWNGVIESMVKELHKSSESRGKSFEERRFPGRKESRRKYHDWGWKDFKKSLKRMMNTIPNINISDMFVKHMTYKKRQVEDAFKSIGHYFKTVQETTQKILDSHTADIKKARMAKNDIWTMLSDLGDKWSEVKNDFFKMNPKDLDPSQKQNEFNNPTFSDKSHNSEEENAKFKKLETKQESKAADKMHDIHRNGDLEAEKHEEPDNQKASWYFKTKDEKFYGNEKTESESDAESWLFARAADRAKLREMYYRAKLEENEQDSPINWYLRKKKERPHDDTFKYMEGAHEDDLMKDEQKDIHGKGKRKMF